MTSTPASGSPAQEPIAVVGVSALMPGSADINGFWRTVVQGRDLVTDVPSTHWLVSDYYDPDPATPDKTYGRRGAFLDPVDFDPLAFGLPPSTLPAIDTSQVLTLVAAQRLLDDVARCSPSGYDRERVSVILGSGPLELLSTMSNRMQRPVWAKAMREAGLPPHQVDGICDRITEHYVPWQEATLPGVLSNVLAGRVANRFDFHGTNFVADAACAGSLAALSSAVNELRLRQADMVITGGVDTLNDVVMYTCFSKTPALSPTGDCRPFSADSDGMVLGEGIVLFALKRLADAEREADAVYAVIRGVGSSSDGHGTAVYAPLPEGQVRALRRAYQAARYTPDTVELMEAHGTGTPAGDAAEVAALRQVFGEAARSPRPWCALGSLKSQFGHTKATAGAAGLLKAVLALHHKVLPPTIKVTRPNPRLGLTGGPFQINTVTRPWIRGSDHPRRASVSSFGFGGTNFHVTAEEYVPGDGARLPFRTRTAPSELVVVAASSVADMIRRCHALVDDQRPLDLIARETQRELARGVPDLRLAVVATDTGQLHRKIGLAAARVGKEPVVPFGTPDGIHYGFGSTEGRVAFLFPGQGSQYVGMGADLAIHVPEARLLWDRFVDVALGDRRLPDVVFPAPAFDDDEREAQTALLTATEWAQPAVAAHSMALLAVLRVLGLRPDCVAGHSLGELTALHAANVLDAESLLRLTRRRGELMRDASREPGGLLAVQASAEDVERTIRALGHHDLWLANHNAPGQIVVAGGSRSVAALRRDLELRDVRARLLPVSAAFHSPLVADAARPLRDYVRGLALAAPACPVYGNTDAATYPPDPEGIADRIARQLMSPVRFSDQVAAMYEAGVRTFVEVGPGAVLTGLVRANLADRDHVVVALDRNGKDGLTALHEGLAALIARGVPLDLAPLWQDHGPASPPPRPSSPATVRICGTNFGKPYPPAHAVEAPPAPASEPSTTHPSEVPPIMPQPAEHSKGQRSAEDRIPRGTPTANGGVAWFEALREVHRLAAETHTACQRTMADAHLAYLSTVGRSLDATRPLLLADGVSADDSTPGREASNRIATNLVTPDELTVGAATDGFAEYVRAADIVTAPATTPTEPASMDAAPMEPAPMNPAPVVPLAVEPAPAYFGSTPVNGNGPDGKPSQSRWDFSATGQEPQAWRDDDVPPPVSANASDTLAPTWTGEPASPVPAPGPQASDTRPDGGRAAREIIALTLQVVADKTGYPVEILQPEMHLQADLGVDSIKRVEVLSALRDRIEGLPALDAAELGRLQTIQEIAEKLSVEVNR